MSSEWHPKETENFQSPDGSNSKETVLPSCSLSTSNAASSNFREHTPLEFIVEEITGKRFVNGRVEMLVKWEGFPPERSSWEPLENLGNCIIMVANFEAKLSKMQEMTNKTSESPASSGSKKKGRKPTAIKTSPVTASWECQLETDTPTGSKSNAKHSNAELKIGENQKEKPPIKLRPALNLLFSDDESPSSSFGEWTDPSPSVGEISLRPASPSAFSDSSMSSDSSSQLVNELRALFATKKANPPNAQRKQTSQLQPSKKMSKFGAPLNPKKKPLTQAKAVRTKKQNGILATPENASSPSSFSGSSISPGFSSLATKKANPLNAQRKNTPKLQANKKMSKFEASLSPEKKPKAKTVRAKKQNGTSVNPIENALHSMQLAENHAEFHAVVSGSKKSKKRAQKIQKQESSDEDPDMPLMTPCKTVFGLARGLELDKVLHSYQVCDRHFLFVTWKGLDKVDTVPMEDLKETYPAQVLEYFENMERRYL